MNTFRLIPSGFRARGIAVVLSSLLKTLLDLAGVALLIPVLVLVMSPGGIAGNRWLSEIYTRLGFTSESAFVWAVCGAVTAVIIVKGLANIAIARFQNRYLMSLYRYYSRRMLDSYYNRGLLFLKQKNSSKLTWEVNYITSGYVQGILMNRVGMMSDGLLAVAMMAGITVYNPSAALMVFALFLPIVFIYVRSIRGRLHDYGRLENEERRRQNRLVQEIFRGYPEIEINNAFPGMEAEFDAGLKKISTLRRKILTVGQTPGVIFETGVAVAVVALVLLRVDGLLLAVFGVVALRMMPAVRGIVSRWITMRNNSYTEEIVAAGIDDTGTAQTGDSHASHAHDSLRMEFRDRVSVRNLSFAFGDVEPVIRDFSLEIRKGERLGIRGVSGGGKTTLFNLLLGLYPPTSGEILVDGAPLTSANRRAWQNIAGYVPQEVFITDSSIAENVALGSAIDRERVHKALEAARLGDFVSGLPDGIDTPIGEAGSRLSGGQKQRLGIARALYKNAEILFFDEATSALDSGTEREINDAIRGLSASRKEITIVIIAHRESSLAFCDRVIEI